MEKILKGIVIKSTGSWYAVKAENGELYQCRMKGKFRLSDKRTTNPIAVGDNVEIQLNEDDLENIVITSIAERKNYIIRKSIKLSKESQILAANIDQAILIVTAREPETTDEFIDRFLITAEAYRIPAILIFNKADIYADADQERVGAWLETYQNIGYKCVITSVVNNLHIKTLANLLKDKISLIAGHSGVGKSSLINAIDSNLNLKTGEISSTHLQGKHTTTFAEMHELNFGGYVIDSPGIRGFGVIDMDKEELSHFFPEIFKKSSECQYYNCTHLHEPGCAVTSAVESGEIAYSRYHSYFNLFNEGKEKYR
jgi:ribosome biogenesis GTPase